MFLIIDIDMVQLNDLIGRLGLEAEIASIREKGLPCGIGPAVMDDDMAEAISRLLKCLKSDAEAQILGPGLVREILYRDSVAPRHRSCILLPCIRVLKIMLDNYAGKLDVEQLSNKAHELLRISSGL